MSGLIPINSRNKQDDDLNAILDGLLDEGTGNKQNSKQRRNSFDDSYSLEDSYASSYGPGSPAAAGDSILGNVGRNALGSDGSPGAGMYSPPSPNLSAAPAPAPAPSHVSSRLEDSNDTDSPGGFMPSFYDPSKSARARRTGVNSASRGSRYGASGGGDELDELGKALAGSRSARRKVEDPFSTQAASQRTDRFDSSPRRMGVNVNLASSMESDDSLDDMLPSRSAGATQGMTTAAAAAAAPSSSSSNSSSSGAAVNANKSGVKANTAHVADEDIPPPPPSSYQQRSALRGGGNRSTMKIDTEQSVSPRASGSPTTSPRYVSNPEMASAAAAGSPAWFSSGAAATGISAGDSKGGEAGTKDAQLSALQQKLDQEQLEREAVERQLRLEVEGLKAKLTATLSSISPDVDAGTVSGVAGSSHMSEYSTKLLKENGTLKRTVSQLSAEVAKLKDEAHVAAKRQRDELKFLKDTAAAEMEEVHRRHGDELRALERRQSEAVEALKKMHASEVEGIKKRSGDGLNLTQLATQVSNTSGSIKLIEEELRARYQAMELAKEGQFEARERLLAEMETKARERAESAESEQYRLKGIVSHMENVISNLRSDSIQEKERMRQEQARMQAQTEHIAAERSALQRRVDDELQMMQDRAASMEAEARRYGEDRRAQEQTLAETRRRLEAERQEFANYIATSSRTAENAITELRAEEERIAAQRTDLGRERAAFEHRRSEAEHDLRAAEERRYALDSARDQVGKERIELQHAARDLAHSTTQLEQRSNELEMLERDLKDRERALSDGWKQMQQAGAKLSKRERDVANSVKQVQLQHVALGRLDNELVQRQADLASSTRAALRTRLEGATDRERRDYPQATTALAMEAAAASSSSSSSSPSSSSRGKHSISDQRALTAELNRARKSLSHARHTLGAATLTKSATQSYLEDETLFLTRMHSAKRN